MQAHLQVTIPGQESRARDTEEPTGKWDAVRMLLRALTRFGNRLVTTRCSRPVRVVEGEALERRVRVPRQKRPYVWRALGLEDVAKASGARPRNDL